MLQYLDQPVADVFDLLEHMQEEPPAYRILAAVHLKPKPRKLTEDEILQQQTELTGMLGAPAKKMPDHIKETLRWAAEMTAKMKNSNQ